MQTKFKDGTVMVCGGCARDAELQIVGEKSNRLCKVGLAVGKRSDPEGGEKPATVWCNVVAWHGLASILSAARKGDSVLVVGRLESRDYEGKTYTDLVAEFVSVCSVSAAAARPGAPAVPQERFSESGDDDGELPF